jgi:hypothetical protein
VAVPCESSSFVGRRPEVNQAWLLLEGSRRMTLVKTGGVGMTWVATAMSGRSPPGTAFAELGALPDPALADGRPMAVTDVKKAINAAGHGCPTVGRAAGRLGIEKRPIRREGGFGIEAWGVSASHRV